ncbi:glycosyltransferase family 9 protein [Aliarcobacter skirrowii]|uniref:glycosyltransferase family 9 protein n=1 Tax=Aliarcobacter skirrowii TaxID=28200 RepID=UPI0008355FCA|nr:glycosyltransferase family 9 protein [Aliarcobacter skirrowii]
MKILVIHTFGLGDMVMFTPAVKNIINKFPAVKIDFLVLQKVSIAPIRNCTNIEQIYFFDKGIQKNLKLLKTLRANNYEYILHTSGTKVLKISIMMFLLKGNQKIGEYENIKIPWYNRQLKRLENRHRVESNIEIVNLITQNNYTIEKPFFCLQTENYKFANDYLDKFKEKVFIGIHPGCNEKFANKRWEIEKYIELIERLYNKSKDIKFFIFIGPDEKQVGQDLKEVFTNIELIENTLDNTAALISKMNLFITNDSGLGHIASCFDIDILTIFSKNTHANPNKIFPYSKKSYIIDFKIIDKKINEVDTVFEKINKIKEK